MYRYSNGQISIADFKQPVGMNLKESNRWVKKAQMIPLTGDREALRRPYPLWQGKRRYHRGGKWNREHTIRYGKQQR